MKTVFEQTLFAYEHHMIDVVEFLIIGNNAQSRQNYLITAGNNRMCDEGEFLVSAFFWDGGYPHIGFFPSDINYPLLHETISINPLWKEM